MAYGSLSLLLSRMAKPKVSQPLLKQFVDFEIAEQETVARHIEGDPDERRAVGSIAVAERCGADAKPRRTPARRRWRNSAALRAGSEFDRDYIRYEVEGHRKLLDIQEVYLEVAR